MGKHSGKKTKPWFTMEDFEKALDAGIRPVVGALLEKAAAGDMAAIKIALSYKFGQPRQQVELTGKDGAPIVFKWTGVEEEKCTDK